MSHRKKRKVTNPVNPNTLTCSRIYHTSKVLGRCGECGGSMKDHRHSDKPPTYAPRKQTRSERRTQRIISSLKRLERNAGVEPGALLRTTKGFGGTGDSVVYAGRLLLGALVIGGEEDPLFLFPPGEHERERVARGLPFARSLTGIDTGGTGRTS